MASSRGVTTIAVLFLFCFAACGGNEGERSLRVMSQDASLLPRLPPPANMNLRAIVTGLSNAAPVMLRFNSARGVLVTKGGACPLLTGVNDAFSPTRFTGEKAVLASGLVYPYALQSVAMTRVS